MTVKPVKIWPNSSLKEKTALVENPLDETIISLIQDLKETATAYSAQGLAANQIGVLKRVLVFLNSDNKLEAIINPEIISKYGEVTAKEGCLSFPGVYVRISRHAAVTVAGLDENTGLPIEFSLQGLPAVVIQHEMDHLDGITMLDHLGRLERHMVLKKLEKTKKKLGAYK